MILIEGENLQIQLQLQMRVMLTKKCVADVLRDLVARLRLREVTQFLVQHSFELKQGSVSPDKLYHKSGYCSK